MAFGALAVQWADAHFAHRFACGPAPVMAPDRGWAAVWYDLQLWLRCIAAWAIALALLSGLILLAGPDADTQQLHDWFRIAFGSVVLWFIFGPVWSLVFFRRSTTAR